jgi:hypothetical protein
VRFSRAPLPTNLMGLRNTEELNREKPANSLQKQTQPQKQQNDKGFCLITFTLHHLPKGLIGLLLVSL